MGMRIQGGSYSAAEQMQWQQRRQNFEVLSQSISSGTLSSAKDALAKILSQSGGGAVNPDSFLGKISAALESGDMTAAQQILASRQNQNGGQAAGAQATTAADASSASTTAPTGRHHHHRGGDASPALALNQAIQSGDAGKAQSAMQSIIADLQQLSSATSSTGSGSSASGYASQASSAAQKLLQNPDFQALEDAVAKGDTAGMKSAWTKLIAGAGDTSGTTAANAQTQVAA